MEEVTDTQYDAYLEGLAVAEQRALLSESLIITEQNLEDVRRQIEEIEANCTYYMQDGQRRIKGYRLEEQFEDLLAQEEELELQVTQLDERLASI